MGKWLRDIWDAVSTVAHGMWVTLRYWIKTYEPSARHVHPAIRISRKAECRWPLATAAFIATI